jgi:VWFA-related protein
MRAAGRLIAALIGSVAALCAQFKSTVPLVVAPTTVTDEKGRFVDGLTDRDLVLYDNNVPQAIQVDTVINPISLVVLIEASFNSAAMLDKLGRSGVLFTDMLAAEAGETAVMSFSDRVKLAQGFTTDGARVTHAVRALRVQGDGVALYEGVSAALDLLATRSPSRRRVLLVIAERRDRSSKLDLATLLNEGQLQNTTIYWLTYSTLLEPYTNRRKSKWDRMTDDEKNDPRRMRSSKVPSPEEEEQLPVDLRPGDLIGVIVEVAHRTRVDAANLLTRTTGGRTFNFLKQSGLENAIQAVAEEVHRQYIVSFQPKPDTAGLYHGIRAEVKDRPELRVRTRAGYWSVP